MYVPRHLRPVEHALAGEEVVQAVAKKALQRPWATREPLLPQSKQGPTALFFRADMAHGAPPIGNDLVGERFVTFARVSEKEDEESEKADTSWPEFALLHYASEEKATEEQPKREPGI